MTRLCLTPVLDRVAARVWDRMGDRVAARVWNRVATRVAARVWYSVWALIREAVMR